MENIVGVNGLLYADLSTGECTEDRTKALEWVLNGTHVKVAGFTTRNPITGDNDWHPCDNPYGNLETESDLPDEDTKIPEIGGIDTQTLEELYEIIVEELEARRERKALELSDSIAKAVQKALDDKFVVGLKATRPDGTIERLFISRKDTRFEVAVD